MLLNSNLNKKSRSNIRKLILNKEFKEIKISMKVFDAL